MLPRRASSIWPFILHTIIAVPAKIWCIDVATGPRSNITSPRTQSANMNTPETTAGPRHEALGNLLGFHGDEGESMAL